MSWRKKGYSGGNSRPSSREGQSGALLMPQAYRAYGLTQVCTTDC